MAANIVIVDTSSILFGYLNKKDVFEIAKREFPDRIPVISRGVMRELSFAAAGKGKKAQCAGAALESIKYKRMHVDNISSNVDAWIQSKTLESTHSVVITNDSELSRKLRLSGIRCMKLTREGLLR